MSLMPSLCAALERAGGERLVMRAGERPHVMAGERRHDVATAVLSVNAVEALADQILSNDGRRELSERGSVSETIQSPSFPHPLTARAERVGDDFCVELVVKFPVAEAAAPENVAPPAAYEPPVVAEPPAPLPLAVEPDPPAPVVAQPVAFEPRVAIEPPRPFVRSHTDAYLPVTVVTRVEEAPRQPVSRTPGERADLHGWISRAFARGATTLYLRVGTPASARVDDRIERLGADLVEASVLEEASGAFGRGGDGVWQTRSDGEWVREYHDLGQVSCRMFSDHQGSGLVAQMRPQTAPRLLHKHIPRQVRTACEGEGLVVVSAPTEAAVESLALALADWSGRTRGGYLISLQRHRGLRAEISGTFVSLRTISGTDSEFAGAIRRASHEGPDILLVTGPQSELPLHEAILAATGGRLVIVAVVAPTTVDALRAMLGQTGLDRDAHVRRALAASFRAAIGYRSLRRIGGGRTLIQDVILASNDVRPLLEAGDFDGLVRTQRQGSGGMRSIDEALARATRRGHISLREAATHAVDRSQMVALLRMQVRAAVSAKATTPTNAEHEIHVPISLDDDRLMDGVGAAATVISGLSASRS
jgi:Tfp pilus assembly pilus retraction ATPase PilT